MRVIFDLPAEIQMAIKLRAVKNGWTTGEVVAEAIRRDLPDDVADAALTTSENTNGD